MAVHWIALLFPSAVSDVFTSVGVDVVRCEIEWNGIEKLQHVMGKDD